MIGLRQRMSHTLTQNDISIAIRDREINSVDEQNICILIVYLAMIERPNVRSW